MEPPILKENEFAKLSIQNKTLQSTAKSWFLKFGFYWRLFPSPDIEITLPADEIKKMSIRGSKIVGFVFFILAAVIFGLGFIPGKDQITGETVNASSGQIITTTIITMLLVFLGIWFLRSKTGRLKTLYTSYKGAWVVLYASQDKEELNFLKQLIEKSKAG
ncbi:MAG: hypothetical protein JST17_01475 [Bacteroidetes bacterium]|nr:hypothetical protein [Bacteroidota bacterium]MBS1931952.1 hypothetical protein [Bacteroidota bacterium]